MKLDELLKRIRPLPWCATMDRAFSYIFLDIPERFPPVVARDLLPEECAYITHAANVLPELVEALRRIADKHPQELHSDFADMQYIANKALAKAETINTKE